MRLLRCLPLVCTLALAASSLAHAAPGAGYRVTQLNNVAGTYSWGGGINERGEVAGYVRNLVDGVCCDPIRAAVFSGGVKELGYVFGDKESGASDINDAGALIGWSGSGSIWDSQRAFIRDGTTSDFGTSAYFRTGASDINNAGQVTGNYFADSYEFPRYSHAFVYSQGSFKDLGTLGGKYSSGAAINDNGVVVGSSSLAGEGRHRAFVYTNGVMSDLGTLGGSDSYANDINNLGHIAGASDIAGDSRQHAFLYADGVMTDLGNIGFLAQTHSEAVDVNDHGDVIGFADRAEGPWTGRVHFLYSNGEVIDLATLLDDEWRLDRVVGINNAGQIVVNAFKAGVGNQVLRLDPVSIVPEPAHWAMLLAGLGVLGVAARRRSDAA